ncbi:MAG: hypothetical protein COV01_03120 [Candidatus Taylorbacteria bacterium CG10_big_fil_rev_8_21_14_0_10_41_48]|uniref:DUF5666 domain-containing protein n=1 Tax=Candidatus Taylorbacteria bacterium CG10_big_fil_rev_8_21_14_0_10_41_48 TaxID=1975024 RepID=A0A2M8LBT4_9BACT|nr:MAG: hypothetical protein COV01_03120 [Candidatus Taylorbacteria bacterium CG10_big_fil_rev_8_21_14_0_10_41_48]
MKNIISSVIALALSVIAINMTYSNIHSTTTSIKNEVKMEQKVVRVVGRVTSVFDGLGADVGFLVKDGDKMSIARYDKGSMADMSDWRPEYVNMITFSDGRTVMDPITVQAF